MKIKALLSLAVALLLAQPAEAFFAYTTRFGGDGSDGDITKSGTITDTAPTYVNANKLTVSSGAQWNVKSDSRINAANSVSIAGTVTVGTSIGGPPSDSRYGVDGGGAGGGMVGLSYGYGSTGGGFGGRGGNGGQYQAYAGNRLGGASYTPATQRSGSAGASGMPNTITDAGGAGGDGGGCFEILAAGAITISGAVNINGGNGGNGTTLGSGGGGGSGGYGLFASVTSITVSGTNGVTANGGTGGNGAGTNGLGGSGGGGGYLVFIAPSISLSGGTTTNGGSAGTPAGTVPAQAGSTGVTLSITQKPNLPLLVLLRKPAGVIAFTQMQQLRQVSTPSLKSWLAAWHAKPEQFADLYWALRNGPETEKEETAMPILSDSVEVPCS